MMDVIICPCLNFISFLSVKSGPKVGATTTNFPRPSISEFYSIF